MLEFAKRTLTRHSCDQNDSGYIILRFKTDKARKKSREETLSTVATTESNTFSTSLSSLSTIDSGSLRSRRSEYHPRRFSVSRSTKKYRRKSSTATDGNRESNHRKKKTIIDIAENTSSHTQKASNRTSYYSSKSRLRREISPRRCWNNTNQTTRKKQRETVYHAPTHPPKVRDGKKASTPKTSLKQSVVTSKSDITVDEIEARKWIREQLSLRRERKKNEHSTSQNASISDDSTHPRGRERQKHHRDQANDGDSSLPPSAAPVSEIKVRKTNSINMHCSSDFSSRTKIDPAAKQAWSSLMRKQFVVDDKPMETKRSLTRSKRYARGNECTSYHPGFSPREQNGLNSTESVPGSLSSRKSRKDGKRRNPIPTRRRRQRLEVP